MRNPRFKLMVLGCGLLATTMLSCSDNEGKARAEHDRALQEATREQLEQAVTEREELIELLMEVSAGMDDIKGVEDIVAINGSGETVNNRGKIRADIAAIKQALEERKQKLAELEGRLKNSKINNSKLLATIESLKSQLESQSAEIDQLTSKLAAANVRIGQLGQTVDSLTTRVDTVTSQRDEAQAEAQRQAQLANAVYYCIGSKKELKEHNIVEGGGFLRKSKVLQGDFDHTFFTQADKRSLTTIPLHSSKAKIVGNNHPKGSYEIIDHQGQKVLRITNPAKFWSISDKLVIQID